jgi:hypothetical protein
LACLQSRVRVAKELRLCPMQFPLTLRFKVLALAPQIYVTDASGQH